MLTTRGSVPWLAILALFALTLLAVLFAWQHEAILQIGIRAALLGGGIAIVRWLERS
jgi:hypothetical protein